MLGAQWLGQTGHYMYMCFVFLARLYQRKSRLLVSAIAATTCLFFQIQPFQLMVVVQLEKNGHNCFIPS